MGLLKSAGIGLLALGLAAGAGCDYMSGKKGIRVESTKNGVEYRRYSFDMASYQEVRFLDHLNDGELDEVLYKLPGDKDFTKVRRIDVIRNEFEWLEFEKLFNDTKEKAFKYPEIK